MMKVSHAYIFVSTLLILYLITVNFVRHDEPQVSGELRSEIKWNPFSKADANSKDTIESPIVAQCIVSIQMPESLDFAGEDVPLEDYDVIERLDRELSVNTYWHSNTLQLFKLANRYFPIIEPILEKEGIPDDFKYLAVAESGLRDVTSPAGAKGVWQIMAGTGKDYGLEIGGDIDERYHIEKSTKAACDYLNDAYEKFGSWALAAASYNMGMPMLQKRLDEQYVDSYFDLYLNDETSRYVFRILAIKEIFNHPDRYGFNLDFEDLYSPVEFKLVEISGPVEDLPAWAIDQGTSYKEMKLLNPWLRAPYVKNPSKKKYEIKIPM